MSGMRLLREVLRTRAEPHEVLLALHARARRRRLPAPAALCGDWFGSQAVLTPSLRADPVSGIDEAFDVPTRQPAVRADPADRESGAIGGGWFGYLSYSLTDPAHRTGPLPDAAWGWAGEVLRLDTAGVWWFEALVGDGAREATAAMELAGELDALLGDPPPARAGWTPSRLRWPPAAEHHAAVESCIRAIAAGELFQANMCTRCSAPFNGAPAELFAEGVRRLRPARAAYLAGDWGAVVSLSPELFLSRCRRTVSSTPIKGTMPRRDASDDHLADVLRKSTKDVAENVMITDLVRNDLGRVCEAGSVTVPDLLAVRPAPGVWHLGSTVRGTLRPDVDDSGLLRAGFPPGSVTGAPKPRALELIAELEPQPRGVYTGAVGLASPVAGTELNVAIRTLECHDGTVSLGVGGGITADSDPSLEWEECLHKAAPLEALLRGS